MESQYNLITILGPTATGKTKLAAHLAYKINSAVISADSRQVYKNMDIGTGKDLSEYFVNNIEIPHYLIDICNAGEKYNVFQFQQDFYKVYNELKEENIIPILCGGSGLYIESILKSYKMLPVPINESLRKELKNKTLEELTILLSKYKTLHNKTDVDTKNRAIRAIEIADYQATHNIETKEYPLINSLNIGIFYEREILKKRITERLKYRLNNGMIEEVEKLIKAGIKKDELIYYGLEYKFITLYIFGEMSYAEMFEKLNIGIHQFSKRQMTWFRKMEKNGIKINWIDGNMSLEDKINNILSFLKI